MSRYTSELHHQRYRPAHREDRIRHKPCRACVEGKHDQCAGESCYCRQVNHPEGAKELAGVCCA